MHYQSDIDKYQRQLYNFSTQSRPDPLKALTARHNLIAAESFQRMQANANAARERQMMQQQQGLNTLVNQYNVALTNTQNQLNQGLINVQGQINAMVQQNHILVDNANAKGAEIKQLCEQGMNLVAQNQKEKESCMALQNNINTTIQEIEKAEAQTAELMQKNFVTVMEANHLDESVKKLSVELILSIAQEKQTQESLADLSGAVVELTNILQLTDEQKETVIKEQAAHLAKLTELMEKLFSGLSISK